MIIPMNRAIPCGYALYDIDLPRHALHVCRWWLYPIFRTGFYLRELKYGIYRWLYRHRILQVPEGSQASLRQIKIVFRDKLGWPIEKIKGRPVTNVIRTILHMNLKQTFSRRTL